MFTDNRGSLRADAEAIAERILTLSEDEVASLEERQRTLREALDHFNVRVRDLTDRDRRATMSLLYKEIIATIFDFHLSIDVHSAHEAIKRCKTKEERVVALQAYQEKARDLATLYRI